MQGNSGIFVCWGFKVFFCSIKSGDSGDSDLIGVEDNPEFEYYNNNNKVNNNDEYPTKDEINL